MQCLSPVTLRNPKYSIKPGQDPFIHVPCGKCAACQQVRRKLWFFRLKVESDHCVCSYCVTLTYNDNDVPAYESFQDLFLYHPIRYEDIQLFHKRLRKKVGKFRFFAVCEFGTQGLRPHYHICYFFDRMVSEWDFHNAVFENWFPHSRITIDTTNDRACNYILKYCLRPTGEDVPDEFRPRIRCSTKPYIGYAFLNDRTFHDLKVKRQDYSHYLGYFQRLPRIYKDKLFDDEEKDFLSKALKQLVIDREKDQFEKDKAYIAKHPGCEHPSDMRLRAFVRHIQNCAKLKSLK